MEEKESLTLTPRLCRTLLFTSLGLSGLLSLSFLFLPYLALERKASAATDVSLGADWSPIFLELDPDYSATLSGSSSLSSDSHGDISFGDILPTSRDSSSSAYGTMKVLKKTLGINTNGRYYSVYLSSANSSTSLYLNGDTSSSVSVPAIGNGSSTGTLDNPTSFSAPAWGYAVPATGSNENSLAFSSLATYSAFDSLFPTNSDTTPDLTPLNSYSSLYNTGLWAGLTPLSSPVQIYATSTDNSRGFGSYSLSGTDYTGDTDKNHFSIYYAAMIDTSIVSGSYSNQLIYTALASSSALDAASSNIVLTSDSFVAENDTISLSFDLAASTQGLIESSDLSVYLIPHSLLASAPTTAEKLFLASSILSDDETNGTNLTKSCPLSSFSITTTGSTLSCTAPASSVVVNAETDSASSTGEYDLYLTIADYNLAYLTEYTDGSTSIPSLAYVGLQSLKSTTTETDTSDPDNPVTTTTNNYYIDTMQDMTTSVCTNTTSWASTDDDFTLTDNRDNKSYLVRKLADNNCWMAQNLDLDLSTFAGTETLTKDNTDLNSKNTWTPDPSSLSSSLADATSARYRQNSYGSYYNYYAATADSGALLADDSDAEDSICPAGWQLPTGSNSTTILDRSWVSLSNIYLDLTQPAEQLASSDSRFSTLLSPPLSLDEAGLYSYSDESYMHHSVQGTYWTSHFVTSSDTNERPDARTLNFIQKSNNKSAIWPIRSNVALYGFSVRCVAR